MGFAVYGNHGVTHWDQERAYNGVTLYSTQGGDKTHLVDMNGTVVHEWTPPRTRQALLRFPARQRQPAAALLRRQ